MSREEEQMLFGGMHFFAAANTVTGFECNYGVLFGKEHIRRRYIVQGGPGTGKSYLLRQLGRVAEQKGKCVEYYHCSSDTESLDAILIDGDTVVLDGTAPHTVNMTAPGFCDECLNLGAFWDSELLQEHASAIQSKSVEKEKYYKNTYRYLKAYYEINSAKKDSIRPYIKYDKMEQALRRILSSMKRGDRYAERPLGVDAISIQGIVHLPTWEGYAEKLYRIEDCYGVGETAMSMLVSLARAGGHRIAVSRDPLTSSSFSAVYFPDAGVAFLCDRYADIQTEHVIRTRRFLDFGSLSCVRSSFREDSHIQSMLLSQALASLKGAGECHMELEGIYSKSMDFSAKERYVRSLCESIL